MCPRLETPSWSHFHLPACSRFHFHYSKRLFWVSRIGLPKCGCRISWFIWVAWFVPIPSINSSCGTGWRGGRGQKGSTKCFISKSRVAGGWYLEAWREFLKSSEPRAGHKTRTPGRNMGRVWPPECGIWPTVFRSDLINFYSPNRGWTFWVFHMLDNTWYCPFFFMLVILVALGDIKFITRFHGFYLMNFPSNWL